MRKTGKFLNRSKYHNITCKCWADHIHDSRAEAAYCDQLNALKRAGKIKSYEIQKTFPLVVNGKTICTHRVDFVVTGNDGRIRVEEFKGFATRVWAIKKKLFEAVYPDIEYIVVK